MCICMTLMSLALALSSSAQEPAATTPPKVELPDAQPPYYRVRYAPGQTAGELVYGVSYTVWIPPGVEKLRGVIVHQHGCGEGACRAGQTAAFDLHWQALAKKHACALLGPSYEQPEKGDCQLWCDPRHGSDNSYRRALDELALLTGHPELAKVPWALWGHSGGATWVGTMLMLYPQRIACVWLRSGAPKLTPREDGKLPTLMVPDAALTVPAMCNLGTQEGVTVKEGRFARVWENVETFFTTLRSQGALMGVSVDPNSSHDCGNQRYLAIPWMDACLSERLGNDSSASKEDFETMRPMSTESAWLADLLSDQAVPADKYAGEKNKSVWLPNANVAQDWMQYTRDSKVADTTPPPAPTNIKRQGNVVSWDVEADLESGLAEFIILRDGQEIARLPEKYKSPFGRAIFQKNSYSDTPSQPLARLSFTDAQAQPDRQYQYTVVAVNTAGLSSPPASR
ncbi:MAG: hypothetical protein IT423_03795 [Pirellulaceae bacterium]|nr:hypothetical protein [Pirellulaceae bacterium]